MPDLDREPLLPAQRMQDDEYAFPYHYVSQWQPHFTQHFNDGWGIHYVSTIEFLLGELEALPAATIVDIGCGDGRMSREIALRFPSRRVLGLDYSARAIALARAMNQDLPAVGFEQVDVTADHGLAASEAAVLMEVFEHIPPADAPAFLRGIHGLLEPGGTLLVTVPHVNQPMEPKHFRHFTSDGLVRELSEVFEVKDIVPFESEGALRKLVRFLLGNRFFILEHRGLRDILYRLYKERVFPAADERHCRRLFVRAVAK